MSSIEKTLGVYYTSHALVKIVCNILNTFVKSNEDARITFVLLATLMPLIGAFTAHVSV
jgi:hypothetical protein